jgi:hypothetical protein
MRLVLFVEYILIQVAQALTAKLYCAENDCPTHTGSDDDDWRELIQLGSRAIGMGARRGS